MKTLVLLLLSPFALAQAPVYTTSTPVAQMVHAYKICDEGCTITAMPAGTVYQFGTNNVKAGVPGWEPALTATATTVPLLASYTTFGDPAQYVTKELDVQQTNLPQTIVYQAAGSTAQVTVTVPAMPEPLIQFSTWTNPPQNCWTQQVTSKYPDGTDAQTWNITICGPVTK